MSKSQSRHEIIFNLWQSKEVNEAISKIQPTDLHDDLRQELFLVLCEMEESRLIGLHERGELRWFMVVVIRNMAKSETSAFFRAHRKFAKLTDEVRGDWKDEEMVEPFAFDNLEPALSELDDYEAGLFRLYAEMGDCRKIEKATGIKARGIRYVIGQAREKLKQKLRS